MAEEFQPARAMERFAEENLKPRPPPARLIIPPEDEAPDYHSFYKHRVRRKGPFIGNAPDEGMRFKTEVEASEALERLVRRWFEWEKEVSIEFIEGQELRIDYLMWPKADVDFPYRMFGVEVKRGDYSKMGSYLRPLKQAIDYTSCRVKGFRIGDELTSSRFAGERIERVFIFPGADGHSDSWIGGVNRLAGLFHVGMIYEDRWRTGPSFYLSAMRVWNPDGRTNLNHKRRQTIGSGIVRRSRPIDLSALFPKRTSDPRLRRLV
jgi:hypothetical protein